MSSVVISGDTSGSVTLQAPATAGSTTINLPTVSGGSFIVSDSSGNVGIGTSLTSGRLNVASTSGSSFGTNANTLNLISTATAAVGVGPAISFQGNTGNSTDVYGFGGIAGFKESASAGNYAGALAFYTQNSGGSALYDERMRIDSNGIVTGTAGNLMLVSGTSQATTSGTFKDFTGIPSWAKRITVMLIGVSTSGTNAIIVQLGTGATPTYTTSGYIGYGTNSASASNTVTSVTTGLPFSGISVAANTYTATNTITNYGTNNWMGVAICPGGSTIVGNGTGYGSGYIALGAVLTAVRITTVGGTDTFDAGSVNILYE
jgi:hypothetical protein